MLAGGGEGGSSRWAGRGEGASLRSGAVEAWWAHNPQVPRSKLGSETFWARREGRGRAPKAPPAPPRARGDGRVGLRRWSKVPVREGVGSNPTRHTLLAPVRRAGPRAPGRPPPPRRGRCSIVVSIPACHAGDPGSIPGNGAFGLGFRGGAKAKRRASTGNRTRVSSVAGTYSTTKPSTRCGGGEGRGPHMGPSGGGRQKHPRQGSNLRPVA